jgi:PIN domain nuclease of toxin-antitoxin system
MRVLLDTHSLLWFALGDPKLSSIARREIENPSNEKLISPVSYWEVAIKISIGKYTLPQSYEEFIHKAVDRNGFAILHIEPRHAAAVANLPFHHRDPFDRLLIAQAIVEQIPILSGDPTFDQYAVTRIW